MPSPRIPGLVSTSRQLARTFDGSADAEERRRLSEVARRHLRAVDAALDKARTGFDELSAPAQRAVQELERIAEGQAKETSQGSDLRISGLVGYCETLLLEAERLDPLARSQWLSWDSLRERAAAGAERVDALCRSGGTPVETLPQRSRRAYAWLRYLGTERGLRQYRDSCALCTAALRVNVQQPVRVRFRPSSHIWERRPLVDESGWLLTYNDVFLSAPPAVLEALARVSVPRRNSRGRRHDETVVEAWFTREGAAPLMEQLAFEGRDADRPAGEHFDLRDAFARVNDSFFEGQMPRPHLRWSERETGRCMGYYRFDRDQVTLSRSLDQPDVPEFVIDFVLFHELLHKKHGIVHDEDGRRQVHTAEFRQEEARFPGVKEAERWLSRIARRNQRRRRQSSRA